MKAIIYESNAGSAERYAKMLSEKLNIPAVSLSEAAKKIPKGEECAFVGWVFANKIQGLNKAGRKWKLVCACAVGMNQNNAKCLEILKKENPGDIPIFYMRGALDLSKLNWLQRKLLETIRKDLEKQKQPGTEEIISVLRDGCDFISEEQLEKPLAYLLSLK